MQYVAGDHVVYFDVDNTLIMWDPEPSDPRIVKLPSLNGETVNVVPHTHHLEMIKRHKQIGNTVVVWSKSGPAWARNVVEFFQLESYVDLVIGKPTCYYDDLKSDQFMLDHRYTTQATKV